MAYTNVSRPNGGIPLDLAAGSAHKESRPVPSVRTTGTSSGTNLANVSGDLSLGDFYALDANGNAFRAGPGDTIKGLVVGFEFAANPAVMNAQGPLSVDYITGVPASGSWPNIIGIEDNKCLLEMQCDSLLATQVGSIFNLKDAAPDAKFRISQQTLTTAAAGTQFKVVRLKNSPVDNAFGANARVVVQALQMAE